MPVCAIPDDLFVIVATSLRPTAIDADNWGNSYNHAGFALYFSRDLRSK